MSDDDDDRRIRDGVEDGTPAETTAHVGQLEIMRSVLQSHVDLLNATRTVTTDTTQYDNLTNARQTANGLRALLQACIDRAREMGA